MLILPAIDLFERKAVRLFKGDYAQMTVYDNNPLDVGKRFAAAGATWIHMVDLEGAREGTTSNLDVVADVARNAGLQVEIGGGIRNMDVVTRYLDAGVSRVILGTAAITNPEFLQEAVETYGAKVAVGVDIRDGQVSIKGWTQSSGVDAMEFCEKLQQLGVATIICTDISKDGAMVGTNVGLYEQLAQRFTLDVIASGGVSSLDDVARLRSLNLYGAIIGKAYYEGAIDLKEAIELAK